ncbi:hypothetical protein QG516_23830 [Pedobacter gandavensis]|uniref:hypothetical protein n=1 Tax=Pedobacter gandavensis TaxID=2679963 RepID=UPI00247AB3CD|nr:hypothetical protein [Pedobacter gandavensis]WGQ09546.1 hypothetical protein QG516_23830 [Pedobacter gandavensis]
MSTNKSLRSYTAALLFLGLPIGSFASEKVTLPLFSKENTLSSNENFYQDRRDKRQERGKEKKKPDVKEVPQSRRQEKPGEVKPEKRERPGRDDKRRRD